MYICIWIGFYRVLFRIYIVNYSVLVQVQVILRSYDIFMGLHFKYYRTRRCLQQWVYSHLTKWVFCLYLSRWCRRNFSCNKRCVIVRHTPIITLIYLYIQSKTISNHICDYIIDNPLVQVSHDIFATIDV